MLCWIVHVFIWITLVCVKYVELLWRFPNYSFSKIVNKFSWKLWILCIFHIMLIAIITPFKNTTPPQNHLEHSTIGNNRKSNPSHLHMFSSYTWATSVWRNLMKQLLCQLCLRRIESRQNVGIYLAAFNPVAEFDWVRSN